MAVKTHGTIRLEQQKTMRGLEFVKSLVSGALSLNTIAHTFGYDVVEAESGRVAINFGGRIGTAEGRVTDPSATLLAHGTTTCLIFPS